MRHHGLTMIVFSVVAVGTALDARTQQRSERAPLSATIQTSDGLTLVGRVQQVHPPRVITVENRLAEPGELLVLLPEGSQMPPAGTMVQARGILRRVDKTDMGTQAWSVLEQRIQEGFASRPVLLASSLTTILDTATQEDRPRLPYAARPPSRREITVRPASLASLIEELAGFQVRVPYARVVGLFGSRAFLIDSAIAIPAPLGHRDRILVLVDAAALRVPAETLVASTVTVMGVARTLLGVQAGGDVPWPTQLDPDAVKRLEVRAAVLATSVRTADGVELTER